MLKAIALTLAVGMAASNAYALSREDALLLMADLNVYIANCRNETPILTNRQISTVVAIVREAGATVADKDEVTTMAMQLSAIAGAHLHAYCAESWASYSTLAR